ncbi:MAG: HAD-IC family P-type ATPase, partial [Anaerolineales bacterium]|nr:HAD-IC family P-type ATPase [Anaerolineales bacterium]
MSDWYRQEVSEILETLAVDPEQGLSAADAKARLEKYGTNELQEEGIKSPWAILWEQMTEVMVVILIIAAIISILLREWTDSIVILAIVILNAILGVSQEYRAEQAIAALKRLAVPSVRVRRNGSVTDVSARELVPGDIVLVEAGSLIPADGILISNANLSVEEAALTGESEPVAKKLGVPKGNDLPLGDRLNAVFMGTTVTYGRAEMIITETGMETELGHIAHLLRSVERDETPLQQRLARLGTTLAWVALAIIVVVFSLGLIRSEEVELIFAGTGSLTEKFLELFRGQDLKELFLTSIALAVAAIPEGLPAVVTIALALGSQRMLKRNALIRKLPAVETLGSVTVICSDKTGTLTENRMTVTVLDVKDRRTTVDTLMEGKAAFLDIDQEISLEKPEITLSLMLKGMALCNDAILSPDEDGNLRAVGDPTEGALVVASAQLGLKKADLEKRWPRVGEIPFSSERKRMSTIHRVAIDSNDTDMPWRKAEYVVFVKGAIDGLLEICERVWDGDEEVQLDEQMLARILDGNQHKASSGQRVLGLAFKALDKLPEEIVEAEIESGLTFVGMVGMLDPARPEVETAVAECRTAGIRPVMITGDHPLTAK